MAEINYLPLTPDQSSLYALVSFLPIDVLNMTTRINLESSIDEQTILEAMRLTVKRIDYLNMRLHNMPSGETVQYFSDAEPEGIELIDFTKSNMKKVDDYCSKLGTTAFPNNAMDVPLYRFKLLRCPNGKYVMVIGGFHITMDAHALMVVVTYFDKVYSSLRNNTPLPDKLCDCEKLIKWSIDYETSGKRLRDNERMLEYLTPEPKFTSVDGIGSPEFVKGKNYGKNQNITQYAVGSILKQLPSSVLDKIKAAEKATGLSSQLYIMLALRTFLGEVSKTDDVLFVSTASRRATLVQKNGGLSIAHFVYIRSDISKQTSVKDALTTLNVVRNNAYKYSGHITMEIDAELFKRHNVPANHRYWSVNLTYQPYFDLNSVDLKFSVDFLHGGFAASPLYINIMPQDSSGDMWINYLYAKNYIKENAIEHFHSFLLKFLPAAVDFPDKTIADLVEACI